VNSTPMLGDDDSSMDPGDDDQTEAGDDDSSMDPGDDDQTEAGDDDSSMEPGDDDETPVVDHDGDGVSPPDDCDDDDPNVYPGAVDDCDGVDTDCDNAIDEDGWQTLYKDRDGDGYGDDRVVTQACESSGGLASIGGDCDDTDDTIYPGAEEVCDGIDGDCDGEVIGETDQDGDGYRPCDAPADCDDESNTTHPGASEVCDGADNDCDQDIDDGFETELGVGLSVDAYADESLADGSVEHPFTTIAEGIESASAYCALIVVGAGEYFEHVNFGGLDIQLRSLDGPAATSIDGGSSGSVVRFVSGETEAAVLEGFTLRAGTADEGGGIYCADSAPTISGNVIQDNSARLAGGGVYLSACDALLSMNTIDQNVAGAEDAENLVDDDSGQGGYGGGVFISGGYPILDGNTITSNVAEVAGGGIYVDTGSSVFLEGGSLSFNSAEGDDEAKGGGIALSDAQITIEGTRITANEAEKHGGGIALSMCSSSNSCRLEALSLEDNQAHEGRGGGIYARESSSFQILRSIITGNVAKEGGGGIYLYESSPEIFNSLIHCNDGGNKGGGLYLSSSYPSVVNNTIVENHADESGSGLYLYDPKSTDQGMFFQNNLVYQNSTEGITHEGEDSSWTIEYNDVFLNPPKNYVGMNDPTGTDGNISMNPQFGSYVADCEVTDGEFVPSDKGPLLDAGINNSLDMDIEEDIRPKDGNGDGRAVHDIGAWEL